MQTVWFLQREISSRCPRCRDLSGKKNESKVHGNHIFYIKGAFDNLWWPGLVQTMREMQIPYRIIATIKSYLTDREVQLTQGSVTVLKECTKGCPQWSVLGPRLWNFTIDSLLDSEWPFNTKAFAYADDLAVTIDSDSRMELKQECQTIIDNWAKSLKLAVLETKTTCMLNKTPSRLHHRDMNLTITPNLTGLELRSLSLKITSAFY